MAVAEAARSHKGGKHLPSKTEADVKANTEQAQWVAEVDRVVEHVGKQVGRATAKDQRVLHKCNKWSDRAIGKQQTLKFGSTMQEQPHADYPPWQ